MMVGVVAALVAAVFVCAWLDWIVTNWVNNPYVASTARTQFNAEYGIWFSVAMVMFGVVGAVIILLVSRNRIAVRLAAAVIYSSVLFLVASLEDWLYFTVGTLFYHQPYPGWGVQWQWMYESSTISHWLGWSGSWTTLNQFCYTLIWLFIVLPLGLVAIFNAGKK